MIRTKVTSLVYSSLMDIRYLWSVLSHFVVRSKQSFSKDGEDLWISQIFPEIQGTYIDIGSGHPVKNNNTFLFYKRGWKGICVDPVPVFSIFYRLVRPRDTYFRGVCSELNEVTFYEYNPKEYSTINYSRYLDLSKHGFKPRKVRLVKGFSLEKIVREIDVTLPCLLSIDVEGSELVILKQLFTMSFRPRVICAEQFRNQKGVEDMLNKLGYESVSKFGKNIVFVYRDFNVGSESFIS